MKTIAQINVHELLNHPNLPDGYVLVINTECLVCNVSIISGIVNKLISLNRCAWHKDKDKDKDVGPFICTLNKFKDKHPEYFI